MVTLNPISGDMTNQEASADSASLFNKASKPFGSVSKSLSCNDGCNHDPERTGAQILWIYAKTNAA